MEEGEDGQAGRTGDWQNNPGKGESGIGMAAPGGRQTDRCNGGGRDKTTDDGTNRTLAQCKRKRRSRLTGWVTRENDCIETETKMSATARACVMKRHAQMLARGHASLLRRISFRVRSVERNLLYEQWTNKRQVKEAHPRDSSVLVGAAFGSEGNQGVSFKRLSNPSNFKQQTSAPFADPSRLATARTTSRSPRIIPRLLQCFFERGLLVRRTGKAGGGKS